MSTRKHAKPTGRKRAAKKVIAKKVKRKSARKGNSTLEDDFIPPRPAFCSFSLEDEWYGRRTMRMLGKTIDSAKHAPNATHEAFSLYRAATGDNKGQWFCCFNQGREIVHREKIIHPTKEDAARDLLTIAHDVCSLLTMLLEKEPELCRMIAATKPSWPVMVDLTEKDWQRDAAETVQKLGLGRDIKGYLLAARTADENVIRCWATAIYNTLFQTRFRFKDAIEGTNRHLTTEGCPEWARKTLDLPRFTKGNSRQWAKLGEEMLLEQVPEFLDSADLVEKRGSWKLRAERGSRSGKASLRAIHRQAFEDFAKELKNIAPEREIGRCTW